ncbi:L-aspartate oxidase [Persicimonas caeni]|uniref:L-aspartate oxidase n=1 Tax=Persicimonas caeni TaxID=2292766 RepID=A0A4Y6PPG6_PERCE|nr:L-aspartate oxidase [Persicimonas caeni]QDG50160.1 L-aspartate oxidase [Persicimonas caeni]QED31381.1 L-aspartate oxidase [Persicimonas caeni]
MTDHIHITDLLVLGAGLAGMQAALHAPEHRVTLVTAAKVGRGGASPWAKGGVAVPIADDDHPSLHAYDTLTAGAGLCHHGAVQLATEEGCQRLRGLVELGVEFDRASGGELALGREAAHSQRRIVRADGDGTGRAICKTVGRCLERASHVTLRQECRAVSLIVDDGRVVGAWLAHADGRLEAVLAGATVLATGGLGQLYARTSNPIEARGDGLALALRAGARLVDLEFVQFHPTALAPEQTELTADQGPLPLLTEAIRGEGALLVDEDGRRFMTDEHELAELAPRDVVSRAIWRYCRNGRLVYLDATGIDDFATRFPGAHADCTALGLDPSRDLLPVTPAAHYHMGGVAVDLDGRTSVDGLWACGEVASTGLHGANRLASNSLLEALVFGARAGRSAARELSRTDRPLRPLPDLAATAPAHTDAVDDELLARVQEIMCLHVGLLRSATGLEHALDALDDLAATCPPGSSAEGVVSIASLITIAALRRCESRGAHFRLEYPDRREVWRRRMVFSGTGVGFEAVDADRRLDLDTSRARRLPF